MKIADKRAEINAKEQIQKNMLTLVHYFKEAGQTVDFGDKLEKLADKLNSGSNVSQELKNVALLIANYQDRQSKELAGALESVSKSLELLGSREVVVNGGTIDTEPLVNAIREIVINVPESKVSVEMEKSDKIDLEEYRASDIDDRDTIQYIGFVNPAGGWYIVENDLKAGTLRYVFGETDYKKAFSNAASWEYGLLSEAIDALQA